MSSPAPLVNVRALDRRFGRRVALDGVHWEVGASEFWGLVGPNGSGKTTLLKILAGFLRPTVGEVRVLGMSPVLQRTRILQHARFAFAPPSLYDNLTAMEHLRYLTAPARASTAELLRVLESVGLQGRERDRVGTYSFGMRQRLSLALALVPLPELLVLDEPADGLDPLAVLELRRILRQVREEHGVSILLSSHYLGEVEQLVDRLLVLQSGRVIFQGPPGDLSRGAVQVRLLASDPPRAAAVLEARGAQPRLAQGAITLPADGTSLEQVRAWLAADGIELLEFHRDRLTLEAALLRRLREEHGG